MAAICISKPMRTGRWGLRDWKNNYLKEITFNHCSWRLTDSAAFIHLIWKCSQETPISLNSLQPIKRLPMSGNWWPWTGKMMQWKVCSELINGGALGQRQGCVFLTEVSFLTDGCVLTKPYSFPRRLPQKNAGTVESEVPVLSVPQQDDGGTKGLGASPAPTRSGAELLWAIWAKSSPLAPRKADPALFCEGRSYSKTRWAEK